MKKYCHLCLLLLLPFMHYAQSVAISNDNSQPHSSALLELKANNKGLLPPRLTNIQRALIPSPAEGLTVYDSTLKSFWYYRGSNNGGWVELVDNMNTHWTNTGSNIYNTNTANVGIGTSTVPARLTINGTDPAIQLRNEHVAKGFVQAAGNDLLLGTYAANTTGNLVFNTRGTNRIWIDPNGNTGIGTATPSAILTINDANPIVQLRNADVDKGFVQLSGDDIKIGTNITNATGRFVVRTNGADRVTVNENGQVGIGTATPTSELTINSPSPAIAFQAGGTNRALISAGTDFVLGSSIAGSNTIIRSNNIAGIYVHPTGVVSLGSIAATGYRFSVDGKIICDDITTLPFDDWPDYVFETQYPLRSIKQLEQFIGANRHLPGIPSAKEVEQQGVAVGEMQRRLLEKIEELTLYIIALDKKNEAMEKEVQKLKKSATDKH